MFGENRVQEFGGKCDGVRDLAGNFAVGQPLFRTFRTVDTIGPEIAQLRIKNNQLPIGNSTIDRSTPPAMRIRSLLLSPHRRGI